MRICIPLNPDFIVFSLVVCLFRPVPHGQKQRCEDPCPAPCQHVAGALCPREEVQQLLRGNLQCVRRNGIIVIHMGFVAMLYFGWYFTWSLLCWQNLVSLAPSFSLSLFTLSMRTRPRCLGSGAPQGWCAGISSLTWLGRWSWNRSDSCPPGRGSGKASGSSTPREGESDLLACLNTPTNTYTLILTHTLILILISTHTHTN